ncbi:MAG: hypothetical protein QGH60_02125 [Phycisphaerae bacterium]|jgi:hypothetical protein|nr:hypothetical protein [Phycisphaerae bacterium]
MDPVTVGIGAVALAYGVFSGVMRVVNPAIFKKLQPMKEKFGETAGNTIHFIAYIIVPLAVGVALIIAGLNGTSFFGSAR